MDAEHMTAPLSASELAELAARHIRCPDFGLRHTCNECRPRVIWPCTTARLLATIEALREALSRLEGAASRIAGIIDHQEVPDVPDQYVFVGALIDAGIVLKGLEPHPSESSDA